MRGISPIVAVVLFIAISVIAAIGVWYWVGSYTSKPAVVSYSSYISVESCDLTSITIRNTGLTAQDALSIPLYDNNNTQIGTVDLTNMTAGNAVKVFPKLMASNISSGLFRFVGTGVQNTVFNCFRPDKASLFFNGINSYVSAPTSSLNNFSNGTIAMWIYPYPTQMAAASLGLHGAFFSKQQDGVNTFAVLSFGGTTLPSTIQFHLSNGGGTIATTGTVSANAWHHIAATWDGTNWKIYIDGALNITSANTNTLPNAAVPISIGAWSGDGNTYYNGSIDEVRVYNRSLNATEVNNSYLGNPPTDTNLNGYWKFDWDSLDYSGKGNNGTLQAGVTWTRDHTMG